MWGAKLLSGVRKKIDLYFFKKDFKRDSENVFINCLIMQQIDKLEVIASMGYNFNIALTSQMHLRDMLPINICAQYQLKQSLEFLLSHGVSLASRDVNNRSFLMFCIIFSRDRSFDFLDYILKKDVDVLHRDYDSKNALCYLYRCDEPLRLLKMLLQKGANLRQDIGENRNFLDFFLEYYNRKMKESAREKMQEVGIFLLDLMTVDELKKYLKINSVDIAEQAQILIDRYSVEKNLLNLGNSKNKNKGVLKI